MVTWNYNKDVEKPQIKLIPIGVYRCRIEEAVEEKSKSGNDQIKLTIVVSGYNSKLFFYIVFMPTGFDKNGKPLKDITDRNLSTIYDTFAIPEGNLNVQEWIGKSGAVQVKHELYNGNTNAKVHYFISRDKQATLPAWIEPTNNNAQVNLNPVNQEQPKKTKEELDALWK